MEWMSFMATNPSHEVADHIENAKDGVYCVKTVLWDWEFGNKKEEIFTFCCSSPKKPMVAEEIQEVTVVIDSENGAAAVQCWE